MAPVAHCPPRTGCKCLTQKAKIFLRKAGKSHELEKLCTYLITEDAYVQHTWLAENCFLPRQATG